MNTTTPNAAADRAAMIERDVKRKKGRSAAAFLKAFTASGIDGEPQNAIRIVLAELALKTAHIERLTAALRAMDDFLSHEDVIEFSASSTERAVRYKGIADILAAAALEQGEDELK